MSSFISSLLDLIYPPVCFSCGDKIPGHNLFFLCRGCLERISFIKKPVCPVCGNPGFASRCGRCAGARYYFSFARASCVYEGIVSECIKLFKYGGNTYLAKTLGGLLERGLEAFPEAGDADIAVPVPLAARRRRERGFNQSAILAGEAGEFLGKPVSAGNLVKSRDSAPQVALAGSERAKNVRGVFELRNPDDFANKKVLLIDDVYTTGSTVNECARILLLGGASEVRVFTAALKV